MKVQRNKGDVRGAKLSSPKRLSPTLSHLYEGGDSKGREGVIGPELWGARWMTGLPDLPCDPGLGSQLGKQETAQSKGRGAFLPLSDCLSVAKDSGKEAGKAKVRS